MTESQKAQVKNRLNDYFSFMGHPPLLPGKGGPCPVCGKGHKTPNAHMDPKTGKARCFACGVGGDVFDWIGHVEGITDKGEQFKRAAEVFGIALERAVTAQDFKKASTPAVTPKTLQEGPQAPPDFTEYFASCQDNAERAQAYLYGRGISREVSARHRVGFDPKNGTVIIPVSSSFYIARGLEGKNFFNPKGARTNIGGADRLSQTADPVFIVEGMIDAMSIEQAGGKAIALNSTTNAPKLLDAIKAREKCPTLILALDNDDAGRSATQGLADALQGRGLSFLQADLYGNHKDANERLQNDAEGLQGAVRAALLQAGDMAEGMAEREAIEAEQYRGQNSAAEYVASFPALVREAAKRPPIQTGFKQLDATLDGGLFDGLYILGAISSLGKTTFFLQIADYIAANGRDVLLFSLEMSRFEIVGKSISRLTYQLAPQAEKWLAKTTRGITNGAAYDRYTEREKDMINGAAQAYQQDIAGNVFLFEATGEIGPTEIRDAIDKHIRMTGRAPVVMIDYLQILKPKDARASDKQNTDWAVSELKRITREHKTPILAVSSLNRDNYASPINMAAFKESGAIEYSSDVLIGLQVAGADEYDEAKKSKNHKDTETKKKQNPREIELKILKNRNGQTGGRIQYVFYAAFNFFAELPATGARP